MSTKYRLGYDPFHVRYKAHFRFQTGQFGQLKKERNAFVLVLDSVGVSDLGDRIGNRIDTMNADYEGTGSRSLPETGVCT